MSVKVPGVKPSTMVLIAVILSAIILAKMASDGALIPTVRYVADTVMELAERAITNLRSTGTGQDGWKDPWNSSFLKGGPVYER